MMISSEAEIVVWAISSICIILILFILEQVKQKRKIDSLKNEKATTELALLKAQISPHFFFNTLNNLYSLTLKKSDSAPEIILKLSDMMRYVIYKGQQDCISLQEEIDHIKNYISIYKIRLKGIVNIEFIENVSNPVFKVAPLMFIILVENAFKHGVEKLQNNAYVKVNLTEKKGVVTFEVINNYDGGHEKEIGNGIGLENLKNRLESTYPNYNSLEVRAENKEFKSKIVLMKPCKR